MMLYEADNGYQAGKRDYRGNDGSIIQSDYQTRDDRNSSKRIKTAIVVSESPPFPFSIPNNNLSLNTIADNNFQFNTYPQQDYNNYYYYYNQPNQALPSPVNYFTPPAIQQVFPLSNVYTIPLPVQNINLPTQNTQSINIELPTKSKISLPPKQKKKNKIKKLMFKKHIKKQESESKISPPEPVNNNVTTTNATQVVKENDSSSTTTFMQYLAQNFTDMQIKIFQLHHQQRTELITNK